MSADEPFSTMAKRVAHNEETSFGGACVVVFPTAGGTVQLEPVELMMLDSKGDVAQFLATIITRLSMVKDEIEQKARMAGGYGR